MRRHMTIYADEPRRYKKRGKRWSHIFASTLADLDDFASTFNLKRYDPRPFPHYDVSEEELLVLEQAARAHGYPFKMATKREVAFMVRAWKRIWP